MLTPRIAILSLVIFQSLFHYEAFSQDGNKSIALNFHPVFGNQPLILDETIHTADNKDSFSISTFRFYISSVQLLNNSKLVWEEANSYHLVDAEKPEALNLKLDIPASVNYNLLQFNLGIDSATNAQGAGSGELDATKGMYWAWQSGYINIKVEGKHSLCKTRKNAFQFHLGGFRGEDYGLQKISLPIKKGNKIQVLTDVATFIKSIDITTKNTVMTPGKEAVELLKTASKIFTIKS